MIEELHTIVEGFAKKKILVFGDLILDRYLFTTTDRISREAPVLILSEEEEKFLPGGAGSTLFNIKSLGAEAQILTAIGDDSEGKILLKLLSQKKIPVDSVYKFKSFKTPLKTRILSGDKNTKKQQILRVDRNYKFRGNREKFLSFFEDNKEAYDAVVISDYNYNVVSPKTVLKLKKYLHKVPFFLDSRFRLVQYKGITASTPNEGELFYPEKPPQKTAVKLIIKRARKVLKRMKASSILVTLGKKGMLLMENGRDFEIPVFGTTDIVDPAGAGDSVIATFTLSYTVSQDFFYAAILSNISGSISVMKEGAQPVKREELHDGIEKYKDKIIELTKKYR